MHTLRLTGSPFEDPLDVIRYFGAVQSQDFGPAKWSIASRCRHVTNADLDQVFNDGAILRTHVLRPTWHFVLPEDIRLLLQVTRPRVHALNAYYYRQLGLDASVLSKSIDTITRALQGGQHRTRKQLETELTSVGLPALNMGLGYILIFAELDGVICSGALQGKQHTYALLDERVPPTRQMTDDEALAELTLRYFTSHGPATINDLKWWASLTVSQIKRGLAMAGAQLQNEVIEGLSYWFASGPDYPSPVSPTVRLLQAYDEYTVGFLESKYALAVNGRPAFPEGRSMFNLVVILDSQFAGHWRRTTKRDGVEIEVEVYADLDGAQARALESEVQRYAEFQGLPARCVTRRI